MQLNETHYKSIKRHINTYFKNRYQHGLVEENIANRQLKAVLNDMKNKKTRL